MAKNGPNDLIFGILIICNNLKRLIELFFEKMIFCHFFAFFGPKSLFLTRKNTKIGKNSKFSKTTQWVSLNCCKLLVYQKLGHLDHFLPFSDRFSDFFHVLRKWPFSLSVGFFRRSGDHKSAKN